MLLVGGCVLLARERLVWFLLTAVRRVRDEGGRGARRTPRSGSSSPGRADGGSASALAVGCRGVVGDRGLRRAARVRERRARGVRPAFRRRPGRLVRRRRRATASSTRSAPSTGARRRPTLGVLAMLVLTTGGLCLLAPRWLLVAVPAAALNLLSAYDLQHTIQYHYWIVAAGAVAVAGAVGAGRVGPAHARGRGSAGPASRPWCLLAPLAPVDRARSRARSASSGRTAPTARRCSTRSRDGASVSRPRCTRCRTSPSASTCTSSPSR